MTAQASAKPAADNAARRLARLAAIQGLYRIALTQQSPEQVIRDFRDHPSSLLEEGDVVAVDRELFGTIVSGVTQNADAVDEMLAGALDAKFSVDRIEILLRAILRAGAYELHHHGDIDAGIIINDYVDVTHAFFGAKEPGLVNAVLDKLGKNLRSA